MLFAVIAMGVLALAGIVALITLLGRRSARNRARTTSLGAAFVVALAVAFALLNVVSVLYAPSLLLQAGLAVAGLIAFGLFVLVGEDIAWGAIGLLELVGLALVTLVALGALGMSGVVDVTPLFDARASQIADASGFVALLPAEREFKTDYQPIEPLPQPDAGFSAEFEDFWLHERAIAGTMDISELEKALAEGETPMGAHLPPIPGHAGVSRHTIKDQPVAVAEYSQTAENAAGQQAKYNTVILVFQLGGVEIRMASQGGERESRGEWVPYDALTVDELLAIAATLEPVE